VTYCGQTLTRFCLAVMLVLGLLFGRFPGRRLIFVSVLVWLAGLMAVGGMGMRMPRSCEWTGVSAMPLHAKVLREADGKG